MKTRNIRRKGVAGFTLIELLVVVLIIGILAAIAIPQYFKVVERARISEGHAFVAQLKQAQERFLARNGTYLAALDQANVDRLDVSFAGTVANNFGLKYFSATYANANCGDGAPGYTLTLSRNNTTAEIPSRYGAYAMAFARCTGLTTFSSCPNCDIDFKQ